MSSPLPKRILLAVPSTQGAIKSATAVCLVNLTSALAEAGISVYIHNIDAAEIVTARDMFANMLLHSPNLDALLFVDSDMAFAPELVLKLIRRGVEFSAAVCPFRRLHLPALVSAAPEEGGNLDRAIARASEFAVKLDWEGKVNWPQRLDDGFCLAAGVGMAVAYITKAALLAMVEDGNLLKRPDLTAGPGNDCWSFFENVSLGGHRLGEDYSFCYRWTKLMRRELWVCIDETVSHIGHFDFRARYADLL